MWRRSFGTLVLLLLLSGCGGHTQRDGAILLASRRETTPYERNGGFGLYAARPDGRGLHRLTRRGEVLNEAAGWSFSASPDGKRVAYAAAGGWIRIVGLDGGGRRRVARGTTVAWSPRGDRLAIGSARGAAVFSPAGRMLWRLTRRQVEAPASWAPDGKRVALVLGNPDEDAVGGTAVVVDDHGSATALEDGVDPSAGVRWSPDGRHLAYWALGGRGMPLVVTRPDGSGRRAVGRNLTGTFAWSPDSRRLAYDGMTDKVRTDIWTVRFDGRGRRRVTRSPVPRLGAETEVSTPTWSPDSRRIAFVRSRIRGSAGRDIGVVSASGGAVTAATHAFPEGGDDDAPLWIRGAVPRTRQPATVPVRARVVRRSAAICTLGGDGSRVLFSDVGFEYCPGLFAWSPRARTVGHVDARCSYAYDIVSAGRRAAWICPNQGFYTLVGSAGGAARIIWNGEPVGTKKQPPDAPDDLVSDGRTLIVYDRRTHDQVEGPPTGLWRLDGLRPVPIPRSERLVPLAAGGGLVVARGVGAVVVLDVGGRRLRLIQGGAAEAALDGVRLALHRGARVDVYDLRARRKVASRPLLRGSGPPPVLVGLAGDVAAYTAGIGLHLVRLSDGRDVILRLPQIGGELYAHLDARGLVFGYSAAYSAQAGRVGFVALSALPLR